jgi:hypothetical protein
METQTSNSISYNINADFCRADLREVLAEVKRRGGDNKQVGITQSTSIGSNKTYFFEYVGTNQSGYFCTEVRAENAYEARANGWREWLRSFHNVDL